MGVMPTGGSNPIPDPRDQKCVWCGATYKAYYASVTGGCYACADYQTERWSPAWAGAEILLVSVFGTDPDPYLVDPSLRSLNAERGEVIYTRSNSPSVARDRNGNVTQYFNGQRWVRVSEHGEETWI